MLASTTYDGITIASLHDNTDLPETSGLPGLPPYASGGRELGGPWEVRQRHEVADPEAVIADLENGVGSLWVAVAPEELPLVLDGVRLDWISITLDAGTRTEAAADALLSLAARRGVPATALRGCLGSDPLSRPGSVAPGLAETAALARRCAEELPGVRAVVADATPYHEAGGSDAEELGCSIATGLAYLRTLTAHGLGLREAFGQLEFRYAATADQFATLAKLRAARVLWARIAEVCGAPTGQFQHAVTSAAMMTRRDPWTNMLRTTLACFAMRRGRGGRGDRAAVRRRARPARRLLPPDRPQHLRPAGRGGPGGQGDRPGGRVLVRRAPHRRPRGEGLAVVPGDRGGGRDGRGARVGTRASEDRPDQGEQVA